MTVLLPGSLSLSDLGISLSAPVLFLLIPFYYRRSLHLFSLPFFLSVIPVLELIVPFLSLPDIHRPRFLALSPRFVFIDCTVDIVIKGLFITPVTTALPSLPQNAASPCFSHLFQLEFHLSFTSGGL